MQSHDSWHDILLNATEYAWYSPQLRILIDNDQFKVECNLVWWWFINGTVMNLNLWDVKRWKLSLLALNGIWLDNMIECVVIFWGVVERAPYVCSSPTKERIMHY